ncbi:MAG: sugar transferase [Verrucomicrobia bacterium]|jgi:exopolysaccharide biosynthesis polyprenyl glycosylphosphotransferase|nr:sugar transferase [Verrucomicrobiota bacterium]
MATPQQQIRLQIHQLLDACLFAFTFWLAVELRQAQWVIDALHLVAPPPEGTIFWYYLVLIPMAPLVLEWQGYYSLPLLENRWTKWWVIVRSCAIVTGALVLLSFFFQFVFARLVVIWFGAITFMVLVLKDEVMRLTLGNAFMASHYGRRILLLGAPAEIGQLQQQVHSLPLESIRAVDSCNVLDTPIDKLVDCLHQYSTNVVILSGRHLPFDKVEEAIRACELEGVEVWLMADFIRTEISRTSFAMLAGRPLLVFRAAPEASWQSLVKYLIDFVGTVGLLSLLALPMVIIALGIRYTSPGPVLFRQKRAGLNGRPFTMLKFRTMVTNAEQLKQELEALNEMSGPVFKVTNDPRVTPVGRFLRKYSLDELPQLLNVLVGDMSLVGPRPLPVDEVARFDDVAHRRRLSVRPGLTCLWQVSGRSDVKDFAEWVRLDLQYIDNWSLWLDFNILLRTIPAVLSGSGAK